ncbi:hypothetical protein VTI74DRAFT_7859 [Chaetomium olivicolor]
MKLLPATLLALASKASTQNVVHFNISRALPGVHVGPVPSLARRQTYTQELINSVSGGGYYVQVEVGTPGQKQHLLLDTGSSDAWLLAHDASLCTSVDLQNLYGVSCTDTYNPDKSSTSKMVEPDGFKVTYLDGGTASGDYISDDFAIGGTTVKSLQMAYVTKAVRGTGILGLGFSSNERAHNKYPNLLDEIFNQGRIGSKTYSLYLNDRRDDGGSILFGGVDTDKFIGPLHILPIYKPPGGNYSSFEVNFTSLALTYTNGTSLTVPTSILDDDSPAVLDSGTTLSYLPDKIAQQIFSSFNTAYDLDLRMTLVDCGHLQSEPLLHLTFSFAPPSASPSPTTPTAAIRVPIIELILDILPPSYPAPPTFSLSKKACVFGIQSTSIFTNPSPILTDPSSSSSSTSSPRPSAAATQTPKKPKSKVTGTFALLGNTFLRSAYVVYDLSHYQIGLAQANLNSTTSRIVELKADGGDGPGGTRSGGTTATTGLPSLTGVAAQQTTYTPVPTATGTVGALGGSGIAPAGNEENAGSSMTRRLWSVWEGLGVVGVAGMVAVLGGVVVAL